MPESAILLVGDDSNDALITQQALRKAGFANPVIHLNDGEQAIKYLSAEAPYDDPTLCPRPALVLLDLKMPNYGGFDVLTWLRARVEESKIPVIVLTGSIYPEDRKRAMQLGANGYEVKPVDCSEFA